MDLMQLRLAEGEGEECPRRVSLRRSQRRGGHRRGPLYGPICGVYSVEHVATRRVPGSIFPALI